MIVNCQCGIKLKVSDEKITDTGVKIRCPKCGTTHVVRKSGEAAQPAPAMPWFAAAPQAQGSQLVIIAHDSKVVADMINEVLAEAGMTTVHAQNGLEALQKATELKPQAMIVDVGLTGIYGFELCERLKSDPDTRNIKIILLSSVYGLTAYKRAPVTLYGADDYIEKHHITDQLIAKLGRLLSGEPAPGPEIPEVPQETFALTGDDDRAKPVPQRPFEPVNLSALQAQPSIARDRRAVEPPPAEMGTDALPPEMPEIPSVLPITPVTLGTTRKSADSLLRQPSPSAPEPKEFPAVVLSRALREREIAKPVPTAPPVADASVRLDADFFEHEEYAAPAAKPKISVDPEEIEKARRFARIIVSDIALYSQDAVNEGIGNGTFYDVLRDDIAEGRQLYDTRVPADIRATKDYLQEAFDDFIASQKKLR